jgi:hypothetical protein
MRGLFRSALALFLGLLTMGLTMIGCGKRSEDPSQPITTSYQAAFRVPGMT